MNLGVNFLDLSALPTPVNGVTLKKTCSPAENSKGLLL